MKAILRVIGFAALFGGAALAAGSSFHLSWWSDDEKAALQDLRLVEESGDPDRSNRYATSEEAAPLGQRFFFDARFSSNGKVSCATCHLPEKDFQDGTPFGTG